jgi:preprotein translocase subunit SecG
MLYYLIVTLYVIVCGLLIITILLQQGKGGDIANAFGGGSSQAVFGARSGATLLTRATSVLAALFIIGSIALTVWDTRGTSSVVGGIAGPPPPAPAPVATPANATPTPPPPAVPPANESPKQ